MNLPVKPANSQMRQIGFACQVNFIPHNYITNSRKASWICRWSRQIRKCGRSASPVRWILYRIIIPWSKNVCLHRHFCEAVNAAAVRSTERRQPRRDARQPFLRLLYHNIGKISRLESWYSMKTSTYAGFRKSLAGAEQKTRHRFDSGLIFCV